MRRIRKEQRQTERKKVNRGFSERQRGRKRQKKRKEKAPVFLVRNIFAILYRFVIGILIWPFLLSAKEERTKQGKSKSMQPNKKKYKGRRNFLLILHLCDSDVSWTHKTEFAVKTKTNGKTSFWERNRRRRESHHKEGQIFSIKLRWRILENWLKDWSKEILATLNKSNPTAAFWVIFYQCDIT